MRKPKALVLYHYLHSDDVVSAVLFTELCTGLAASGWDVIGCSSNRAWHDDRRIYPRCTIWKNVEFRRIWRPPLRQSSALGRLGNAIWMTLAWSLLAFNPRLRPDVLVVGTDPVFSPLTAFTWSALRPRLRLAHWCFDLYPDAAIADGIVREDQALVRLLRVLFRRAYRRFHLVVDIGGCMRRRLARNGARGRAETIAPWALVESDAPVLIAAAERKELFGDAALALLYSGNFGRAHGWHGIPELAKAFEEKDGRVVFAVRGNAVGQLQKAIRDSGAPIRFADFTSAERLQAKLSAADIHIVSLREEWTGTVVPSKFFGALAIGRPVLFAGGRDSAIARWIEEFRVGWVLDRRHIPELAEELLAWSHSSDARSRMFHHCHAVYLSEFSREKALQRWDVLLREMLRQTTSNEL